MGVAITEKLTSPAAMVACIKVFPRQVVSNHILHFTTLGKRKFGNNRNMSNLQRLLRLGQDCGRCISYAGRFYAYMENPPKV